LTCPNCDHGVGCAECRSSRNCAAHWQYLLENDGTRAFLQCPSCFGVWTVDTPAVVRANRSRAAGADIKDQQPGDVAAPHHRGSHGKWDGGVIAKIWLGACPRDIVTSPTGGLVWVMTADSVKAIKGHHVVASLPIGAEPKQMMMSSDGSRIYVTGYDGSLSIIDPLKMMAKTVVKQISTAAVVSPDGAYIYLAHGEAVGHGSSAWITVLRADGIAVARIAVDRYTTGMAVSPNGRRLYVASVVRGSDHRGGTIAVVDTASYKTVDIIAVDEAPESLAVDAEGLLYVTHYHTDSVSVIDPGTQCIIAIALDDAPMEVVARPESEFIYTANLHSVTAIDPSTAATKSFALGELPRRLTISPDGRRLYATDFACGTVWCLDISDNSLVGTVAACAHPAAVALSPTGAFLYVTDSRDGTLTVISTTAINPHPQDTP
jgi:DNA-binding beta-propeller fold protein YncE